MNKTIKGSLVLLLTAIIWGVAFVSQSAGMEYVGPFTFVSLRQFLGCMVLLPIILVRKNKGYASGESMRKAVKPGIICGICLITASVLQQIGLQYTTVGKAGFLTALYILFVPILGLFIGKKPPLRIWGCVLISAIGLYLLCLTEGFMFQMGDLIEMSCAVMFAVHILTVDKFSTGTDGITFAFTQFLTAGIVALFPMFLMETITIDALKGAALAIMYAGFLSTGVAYTFQIIGQKMVPPVLASLIMSLESVVSVIAGWLILKQSLSLREIIGCVVMFTAIIIAQIEPRAKETSSEVDNEVAG